MSRKNSGITLVALVVTIIVILIISGVTIAVLNGENGIINNAMKSKEETEYAEIKEEVLDEWYKIEFEQAKNYFEFKDMDETLQEKLQAKDGAATVEYKDDSETLEISFKGHKMNLTEKGKIIENEQATPIEKASVEITGNPQGADIFEGGSAQLQAAATGTGDLAYQWYRTAANTAAGGTAIAGATNATYAITGATAADRAHYYCEVTATADSGKTTSARTTAAYIKVIAPITASAIATTQTEVTVTKGDTLTIGITTSAEGDLTYKWHRTTTAPADPTAPGTGGNEISGATDQNYTKQNAQQDDEGYYYCTVTQTVGGESHTATSTPIHVTTQDTPKINTNIILSADSGIAEYNQNLSFTASIAQGDQNQALTGTWQVTSSNQSNIQITSVAGQTPTGNPATGPATSSQPATITYKAMAATEDPTTITITFIPSDQTTYNQAQATYTVTKINKIPATNPTQIMAYTGTYDSEEHTITVSDDHTGGTVKYRASTDDGNTWSEWSTTKPTRTQPGTTRVELYVEGDANHTDSSVQTTNIYISQTPNYQVASTGDYYNTLAAAYVAAQNGDTIKLLADTTDYAAVVISKEINLDLGSHTISRENGTINVNTDGTLTIYNGKITSSASSAITQTGGTVNIGRQADTFVDVDTITATSNMSTAGVGIVGANYGIYSTGGNWNLYNGAVFGETSSRK